MHLATTFRHMDASQAVKTYAEERLEKIRKYFHGEPIAAHAVFAVERNHNHMAEFHLTLPNGIVIQAREVTEDMYSSIDLAGARIERQVRKWKDKIRDHKPHGEPGVSIRESVIEAEGVEPWPVTKPTADAGGRSKADVVAPIAPAIKVVKEQTFTVRVMRVDDAVM